MRQDIEGAPCLEATTRGCGVLMSCYYVNHGADMPHFHASCQPYGGRKCHKPVRHWFGERDRMMSFFVDGASCGIASREIEVAGR